jgi:hypothetical protein
MGDTVEVGLEIGVHHIRVSGLQVVSTSRKASLHPRPGLNP